MATEKIFLPCEFCYKMIVLKHVFIHQVKCQLKNDLLNKICDDENNDVTLPCEFCEISMDLNNLMCHQIVCRKNLKKIKNSVSHVAEKTETSLHSTNILPSNVNETLSYQNEFNQNQLSVIKTKTSIQNSSLDLNLPSTSQKYAVPILVLRKPKSSNDHSCSSPLSLKENMFLPVKCNSDINSMGVTNVKNKMHNNRSPFLSSYGRNLKNNSTCNNASYSEHNYHL